jgi:hypothetical protein
MEAEAGRTEASDFQGPVAFFLETARLRGLNILDFTQKNGLGRDSGKDGGDG